MMVSTMLKVKDVSHVLMDAKHVKTPTDASLVLRKDLFHLESNVSLTVATEKSFEEFSNVMTTTKYLEMAALLPVQLKTITFVTVNLPSVKAQLLHHQHQIVEMAKKMQEKDVMMGTLKTVMDAQVVVQPRRDILVMKVVPQCVQKQQET